MRRHLLAVISVAALTFVGSASTAVTAITANATVEIRSGAFSTKNLTINQGDTVIWKNVDKGNHQVVANGGQFSSPILRPGRSFAYTFRQAGTFRYHDGLHPSLRATVNVKGAPPQVTLAASAPVVRYGTQVTLSGTVSNRRAGETVTLVQLPYGATTKQVIATLQTSAGGAFSFTVTPQIGTTYQAQWKGAESSVVEQVAPMLKLPAPSRSGYWHFYVVASTSFAGHFVYVQRYTQFHQWVNIAKLTLGARSGRLIAISAIRHIVPRGRSSVRVVMTADQVGPGYLETASGSQPIVRR
jgi:plastocyanin